MLLALPSLLLLSSIALRLLAGARYSRPDLAARLDRVLIEVGREDAFQVWVNDRTLVVWGVAFSRRGRPSVVAASDFVARATDEQLRGVAALQHATRCDPDLVELSRFSLPLAIGLGAAFGLVAAILVPGALGYAAGWASVGLLLWLMQLWVALRMRAAFLRGGYESIDRAACALVGDATVVAALEAMSVWRQPDHTLGMRVWALLIRLALPVPTRSTASARAARLLEPQPSMHPSTGPGWRG